MASALKVSAALGLFGLVALGAILVWYFKSATPNQNSFYLEGTDDEGAQIRLSVSWVNNLSKVEFEILTGTLPTTSTSGGCGSKLAACAEEEKAHTQEAGDWSIYKSTTSYAETDPTFYFYSLSSADTSAWSCTKVQTSTGGSSITDATGQTVSQLGLNTATQLGEDGGLVTFDIVTSTGDTVPIHVIVSPEGVTNFGGYEVSTFTFGQKAVVPFYKYAPELPATSTCVFAEADEEPEELNAVADTQVISCRTWNQKLTFGSISVDLMMPPKTSQCEPLCSSLSNLFAYLAFRTYDYSETTAKTYCKGQATEVTCDKLTFLTDTNVVSLNKFFPKLRKPTNIDLSATDTGFKCKSLNYGTWIQVSGTTFTSITDWVRNIDVSTTIWNGMNVHNGFFYKYKMWISLFKTWTTGVTKVVFNGHSLGGAIAQIAAVAQKVANPSQTISLRTYGSPATFAPRPILFRLKAAAQKAKAILSLGVYKQTFFEPAQLPLTTLYSSIPHARYVNLKGAQAKLTPPWPLPSVYVATPWNNQCDVVPQVTGLAGFKHPASHAIAHQSYKLNAVTSASAISRSWTTAAIPHYAVLDALDGKAGLYLHQNYIIATEKSRPSS